jgi:hypothetical protein
MRTDKTGDGRGRPRWRSSFVGDPGAIFSGGKRDTGAKQEEEPFYEEKLWEVFLWLGAGGKDLFSGMQDMCHHGGSKDE